MKKLFIFSVLFFLAASVFANPVIPKLSNYLESEQIDYTEKKYFTFVDDSGQNIYKIFSIVSNNEYTLWFKNKSLLTNIEIILCMKFSNESALDDIISDIDTSDLKSEFSAFRRSIINYNIKPIIETDKNNNPIKITYYVTSY